MLVPPRASALEKQSVRGRVPILTGVRDISRGAKGRLVVPQAGCASPWPPLVSAQESLALSQNTSSLLPPPIAAHQAAYPFKNHWPLYSLALAVVSQLGPGSHRPSPLATQFHFTLPGVWPEG